jgi:hypothetical protein
MAEQLWEYTNADGETKVIKVKDKDIERRRRWLNGNGIPDTSIEAYPSIKDWQDAKMKEGTADTSVGSFGTVINAPSRLIGGAIDFATNPEYEGVDGFLESMNNAVQAPTTARDFVEFAAMPLTAGASGAMAKGAGKAIAAASRSGNNLARGIGTSVMNNPVIGKTGMALGEGLSNAATEGAVQGIQSLPNGDQFDAEAILTAGLFGAVANAGIGSVAELGKGELAAAFNKMPAWLKDRIGGDNAKGLANFQYFAEHAELPNSVGVPGGNRPKVSPIPDVKSTPSRIAVEEGRMSRANRDIDAAIEADIKANPEAAVVRQPSLTRMERGSSLAEAADLAEIADIATTAKAFDPNMSDARAVTEAIHTTDGVRGGTPIEKQIKGDGVQSVADVDPALLDEAARFMNKSSELANGIVVNDDALRWSIDSKLDTQGFGYEDRQDLLMEMGRIEDDVLKELSRRYGLESAGDVLGNATMMNEAKKMFQSRANYHRSNASMARSGIEDRANKELSRIYVNRIGELNPQLQAANADFSNSMLRLNLLTSMTKEGTTAIMPSKLNPQWRGLNAALNFLGRETGETIYDRDDD